jgi:hypothetical protein
MHFIDLIKQLAGHSIWARASVSARDERVSGLLRWGFPWLDVCLVVFGTGGLMFGIPALRDVFSPSYAQSWSGGLAVVAFVCLIGVAFPQQMWRVEMYAKALLVMMLAVYGGSLIAAGVLVDPDDFGRSAVAFVPVALIGPVGWRVFDIPREAKKNGWQ